MAPPTDKSPLGTLFKNVDKVKCGLYVCHALGKVCLDDSCQSFERHKDCLGKGIAPDGEHTSGN